MRWLVLALTLVAVRCATTSAVPECHLDLSAGGFVTELTHAEATHRTPAFDAYTAGSYRVQMPSLLESVRRERTRTPAIRGLIVIGPFGPLWQYDVELFLDQDGAIRANQLAMPHARITWKATQVLTSAEFAKAVEGFNAATSDRVPLEVATVMLVTWTNGSETTRASDENLYQTHSGAIEVALDRIAKLGEKATTTYSNDLGDDLPIAVCSPPR